MFIGWCFQPIFILLGGAFSRNLYFRVQTGTKPNLFLVFMFIGWCFQSQLVFSCTNRHQNKPIFIFLMFIGWCFQSQLVLSCTNRHQTKPIFSCLCLLGGAFSRNLYFRVQTGTKPNLFLVVYVYWVVLSVATCTFVYKQAPKQTYLTGGLVVYVFGMVLLVANKPILQGFRCLCLGGGECF